MMDRQRADLGFGPEETTFDPADWAVGTPPPPRAEEAHTRAGAEASGFRSREAVATPAKGQGTPLRRRRTGRNAQFNLKARPDTIARFTAVADAQGWGLGETLEHAVALLERDYPAR